MRSFISLDQLEAVENFHLLFLIKLSRHLGYGAHAANEVIDGSRISPEEGVALHALLSADYGQGIAMPYDVRKSILELLLAFYQKHIENMGEIRSVDVLKEILR